MSDLDVPLTERVLKAAETGTELVRAPGVPADGDMSGSVPAEVVREALEGKNQPLHWRGLRLQGFCIEGDLDLSYMRWQGELSLVNCRVTGDLILDHARPVGRVCLDGSHVKWVSALNAVVDGTFSLRNTHIHTGLYALGIRVTESLNLRTAKLWARSRGPAGWRWNSIGPISATSFSRMRALMVESTRPA